METGKAPKSAVSFGRSTVVHKGVCETLSRLSLLLSRSAQHTSPGEAAKQLSS